MAKITISINDETLVYVLNKAIEGGVSLDDVINEMLKEQLNADDTQGVTALPMSELEEAMNRAKKLPQGSLFTLNAANSESTRLFSVSEWEQLSSVENFRPTSFGKKFRTAVTSQGLAKQLRKTPDNKQIYERL